jgi:hypothetical protein
MSNPRPPAIIVIGIIKVMDGFETGLDALASELRRKRNHDHYS